MLILNTLLHVTVVIMAIVTILCWTSYVVIQFVRPLAIESSPLLEAGTIREKLISIAIYVGIIACFLCLFLPEIYH